MPSSACSQTRVAVDRVGIRAPTRESRTPRSWREWAAGDASAHSAKSHLFFFNDTATTEICTLSLHDALPIFGRYSHACAILTDWPCSIWQFGTRLSSRSEEHTSELQSHDNLVCRLLLEK